MNKIVKYMEDGKCVLLNLDNFRFVRVNNELLKNNDKLMGILDSKFDFFEMNKEDDRKTIYYTITKKCNMKCEFCANNSSPYANTEDDININTIQNIVIPKLEKFSIRRLVISGGEPLLKPDFKELIIQFSKKFSKEKLVLQTNGLLLNEEQIYFLSDKISYIEISVENIVADRKLQEKMEHVFENVVAHDIKLVFSFVVTTQNKSLINSAINLSVKYHAYFELRFVAPLGRAGISPNLILKEEDILEIYIDIINYILKHKLFRPELEKIFFFKLAAKNSCGAMGNILAIQPNGDIYMCPNLQTKSYYYGNIVQDTYKQISDMIKEKCESTMIKEKLCVCERNLCVKCPIKYFCTGACAAELDHCELDENRLCNINILFYRFMLFKYTKKQSMEYNLKLLKQCIIDYLEKS